MGNVLLAVVVNGLLLFAMQQWLQFRIRVMEERVTRETSYREKSLDLLVTSYKTVWGELAGLQHYVSHQMARDLADSDAFSTDQWSRYLIDVFAKIDRETLFLPDETGTAILRIITQLEVDFNAYLDTLRAALVARAKDAEFPEAMAKVNEAKKAMGDHLNALIAALRIDYRNASQAALLGRPSR